MNSGEIKAAFAKAGVAVRVKALRANRFRVCRLGDAAHDQEVSRAISAAIGLRDCFGNLGGDFNQPHEMVCNA